MTAKCSHEDSRLTCIDCNNPICSQCLVQCPVGFRCKSCAGQLNRSHTSGTTMLVARTLALCVGIGFGAGWAMPYINVPFISCLICYFLGLLIGRWLAKIIDFKMGNNVAKIIVFGLLIGMSLSPLGALPFLMMAMLRESITSQGSMIFAALTSIVGILFCPVCFIVGILRPTVWGERW